MFAYVIVVNALFIGLNIYMRQEIILFLTVAVSVFFYVNRALQQKTPATFAKIVSGESPHQLLYVLWLYFNPKEEYAFYVPLALSTLGKICMLVSGNSEDSVEKGQELILFQTKC